MGWVITSMPCAVPASTSRRAAAATAVGGARAPAVPVRALRRGRGRDAVGSARLSELRGQPGRPMVVDDA
ncbi:hypothetical protein ACFRH6_11025 [Streptomyces sp. NPDC056749]|uniref:hypothetical protein n=1 Tax=Streptomyces sp. NPDC056749 TaxID=3345936 RepID=UPI0036B77C22